ncbi:unnamed protein product [Bubo scandiacus]
MALPGAPAPAPAAAPAPPPPPTVLMAVRAGLARPSRLPPLPAAAALRLQLSVEPAAGGHRRFRLGLRHSEAAGGANVAEYDLKDVSYKVRSPTCHELTVLGSSDEPLVFDFEEEREAQKWWTIVSSSLREVQKAADSTLAAQASSLPAAAGASSADQDPEAALSLELSEKEDLALHLAQAIEYGDEEVASQCAVALARQQATLSILLKESNYPTEDISMKVGVEDATSSASITLRVRAHTTIATLKQQVFQDYGFHPLVQRWIIGQCLCVDERTVSSYGIRRDGDTAFLYLLSAKMAELTEQRYEEDQAQVMLSSTSSLSDDATERRKYNTLPNMLGQRARQEDGHRRDQPAPGRAADGRPFQWPVEARGHQSALASAGGLVVSKMHLHQQAPRGRAARCAARTVPRTMWSPGTYKPDETELWRMQQEQEGILQYQQALEAERLRNFQQLLQLEEEVLVASREVLECRICYQQVAPGRGGAAARVSARLLQGVPAPGDQLQRGAGGGLSLPRRLLRLRQPPPGAGDPGAGDAGGVQTVPGAEPGAGRAAQPQQLPLQNHRLPRLVHLRGFRQRVPLPHLPGPQLPPLQGHPRREKLPPVTRTISRSRPQNDSAARRQTKDMLQTLVQLGEAMHCPTCLIVVQKKDGCDWIRCTVCQTEICWVTKGPRWGPGGPGDTSGGCRCNVNGQRCHPPLPELPLSPGAGGGPSGLGGAPPRATGGRSPRPQHRGTARNRQWDTDGGERQVLSQ